MMQSKVDPRTFEQMVKQGYEEALRMGWRGAPKGTLEYYLAEKRYRELVGGSRHPAYPTVSVELENLPKRTAFLPDGSEVEVELIGSISLQKEGKPLPVEFSQNSYKIEATQAVSGITQINGLIFPKRENASFITGLGTKFVAQRIGIQLIPGGVRMEYEVTPQPLQASYRGWKVSGTLGYRITVKKRVDPPWYKKLAVEFEHGAEQAFSWLENHAEAVGWLIVGAGTFVFTITEDALTFGAGTLDDPATIAMATAAITTGIEKLKGSDETNE